jgi:glucose-1-phosphate cytidylyltransferase
MLTYGDGLADIDTAQLWAFHQQHGKMGTVTGVRPISRYGELAIDGGRVRVFSKKPQADEGFISGGFFVFHRRFFDYLENEDNCVLEREPLDKLTRGGELISYTERHK